MYLWYVVFLAYIYILFKDVMKNNIVEDKPKLIIDYSPEKISKTIFEQIPLLHDYYTPLTETDMIVYERKDENQILETSN